MPRFSFPSFPEGLWALKARKTALRGATPTRNGQALSQYDIGAISALLRLRGLCEVAADICCLG